MIRRLIAVLFLTFLAITTAGAEEIFALTTGGTLLRFDSATPSVISSATPVTGLQPGETLVGIDFRTNTGQLYGVGSTSRVYTIHPTTGAATVVGAPFSPGLAGGHFAINFNPTVDRLRLVSETGQNLRLNPMDGAVSGTDTVLAYGAFDPGFGTIPRVVSAGYTNNLQYATSTTLYAIDSSRKALVTIGSLNSTVSPNGGTIFTVGRLGVDTGDLAALDISGQTGVAYASLTPTGSPGSRLYKINLSTGTATLIGPIALANSILAIAVVPAATPFDVVVLRSGTPGGLTRIDVSAPALSTSPVNVSGLGAGEFVLSIGYRRLTGVLYALGSSNRIYTLDPVTGAATALTPSGAPLPLNSTLADFSIDPVTDRIRVVTDTDLNLSVDPVTGLLISNDTALAYRPFEPNSGINPTIRAIAFDNPSGGSATLFGIDGTQSAFVKTTTPANGQLATVGLLGVSVGSFQGLDVAFDGTIFAALNSGLHTINATTGAATVVPFGGMIGAGNVRAIAAVPDQAVSTLQFTASTFKVIETNTAFVTISRSGPASGVVSVDYEIAADTAEAESNFTPTAGTLTFLHGESSRTLELPIRQNGSLDLLHTATMTLSNPIGAFLGVQTTSTLVIGDLNDRDGDGFPNDVEIVAGTDPENVNSTSFGGMSATNVVPLVVRSAAVRLNFTLQNRDTITFAGTIPNLQTTVPPGAQLIVQLGHTDGSGGIIQVFTFDAKGRPPKGLVFGKPVKGVSKFSFTMTKQNFASALAGSGFVNHTLTKVLLPFESAMYFNFTKFTATRNVLYTAKETKSGAITLTK